jgi:hypothetical protein
MKHVRFLAFGLAALAAVTAVGCCHTCGNSPPTQSGYYSPCCGSGSAAPITSGSGYGSGPAYVAPYSGAPH